MSQAMGRSESLARELDCSEALVRQRVSRGLRRLRARMEEDR
jgi:DNA-directed RNA polymerase specialized sigma24 family protein